MRNKNLILSGNTLRIVRLESIRTGFYQFSGILLLVFVTINLIEVVVRIVKKLPVIEVLFLWKSPIFTIIFLLIPIISLILARRFPPAPVVTFHNDTQKVSWKSGANQLDLPFDSLHFATSRLLSKSGLSTVMVTIFSITDRPFFEGEQPSQDSDMRYRKDLCVYKAGTQNEADESIEIIRSFMAGIYDGSPSMFVDL